jgi:ankyrin repeat protein
MEIKMKHAKPIALDELVTFILENDLGSCALYLAADHVNALDALSRTPLHYAASVDVAIAELLISRGAEVNWQDVFGRTPIYYAISASNFAMIISLINAQANLEVENLQQETPLKYAMRTNKDMALYIAISQQDYLTVRVLLENHASFNYQGNTPLHIATSLRDERLVSIVVHYARDLDISAQNIFGQTALDIARSNHNTGVFSLPSSHISDINAQQATMSNTVVEAYTGEESETSLPPAALTTSADSRLSGNMTQEEDAEFVSLFLGEDNFELPHSTSL